MNPSDLQQAVPIIMGEGASTTPFIPFKGLALPLEQNLLPGTNYLLGASDFFQQNMPQKMSTILYLLNNITELIAFIILHDKQAEPSQLVSEIKISFEKQLSSMIENLEQNRKNIKIDISQLKEIAEEKYQTLLQNQQRLINQLNELKLQNLELINNKFDDKKLGELLDQKSSEQEKLARDQNHSLVEIRSDLTIIKNYLKDPGTINQRLSSLTATIQVLQDKIDSLETVNQKYLHILSERYASNSAFSKTFIQGSSLPHEKWSTTSTLYDCPQGKNFPHLYHTFDPQLNNMTDMIHQILGQTADKGKFSNLLTDFEQIKQTLDRLIEEKRSNQSDSQGGERDSEILDLLTNLLKKLDEKEEHDLQIIVPQPKLDPYTFWLPKPKSK